jgi:dipeptidyl-peptidase-4
MKIHITAFLSLIILLFINSMGVYAQNKELTKQQILNRDFDEIIQPIPRFVGWDDDAHYITAKRGEGRQYDLFLVDAATGEETSYTPNAQDADAARVAVNNGDIFYNTGQKERKQLTDTEGEENNPTLSPDGSKVAFTRDRDLYVLDMESGDEQRITNDGSDVIYNGWSSWVYFEEILGRSTRFKAFWWSPNSQRIAFMRFDDSPVDIFPIHSVEDSYGTLIEQRYPKAGFDNPKVKIGVARLDDNFITWADYDQEDDQYFGMPYWTPESNKLWTQWMNRNQDHLIIHEINLQDGSKKRNL